MDLGLMHRLSFTHGGIQDPALRQPVNEMNWSAFNARWEAYAKTGIDLPFGLKSAAFTSVESPTAPPDLVAAFYANARTRGWSDRVVTKVCDEPTASKDWAECAANC